MNNCQPTRANVIGACTSPVAQREIPQWVGETRNWLDNLEGAIADLTGNVSPIASNQDFIETSREWTKQSTILGDELMQIAMRVESATQAIRRLTVGIEL